MAHAASALIESASPEGAWDGLAYPFDESLAKKLRAAIAPMDPGLVAAALGDRGDASILLEGGGSGIAIAALTKGDEQPRREGITGAWQRSKELVVGQLRAKAGDLFVEALNAVVGGAE